MEKNNITAQDGMEQYRVKGVKPSELPTKTSYELNSGNKENTKQKG